MSFYGVFRGRSTGVFDNWNTVQRLVNGYSNPIYKKFKTKEEAQYFATNGKVQPIVDDEVFSCNTLQIFTDGSMSTKTGLTAIGIAFGKPYQAFDHSEQLPENTTNQLAELYSIAFALQITVESILPKNECNEIEIWTDSDYSVNCVTVWGDRWEQNGWLTAGGDPVKYQLYIEYIRDQIQDLALGGVVCTIRHIKEVGLKSHQGKPSEMLPKMVWEGNRRADILARALTI